MNSPGTASAPPKSVEARERRSKAESAEPLHPKVQSVYGAIQAEPSLERVTAIVEEAVATSSGLELARVVFDLLRLGFGAQDAGADDVAQVIFEVCQKAHPRLVRVGEDGTRLEVRLKAAQEWTAWSNESRVAAKVGEPPKKGSVPLSTLSGFHRSIRR